MIGAADTPIPPAMLLLCVQVYHRGSLPMDAGCLIIDPKSPKLRRWDLYIMVLLIWTAVITPYEVAFTEPKLNVLFFINRLIDLSFGIVRHHSHSHPPAARPYTLPFPSWCPHRTLS